MYFYFIIILLKGNLKIEGENLDVTYKDEGHYIIKNNSENASSIKFQIKDVECNSAELLIVLEAKGEKMSNYPEGIGRLIQVQAQDEYVTNSIKHKFMSWMNESLFNSEFYFSNIKPGKVTIDFNIEGNEPVEIYSLKIYNAPHVVYREFENGIVLANLSHTQQNIKLNKLSPNNKFKRLQATAKQDSIINNGDLVGEEFVMPPRDALFLAKIKN